MVSMDDLASLEKAVLTKLLDGDHPVLKILRVQSENAAVVSQDYTGVGFFCSFAVPPGVPRIRDPENFEIGDVFAKIESLQSGAGFLLFIRSGVLDMLEGYTYGDESWPEDIKQFELRYNTEPRRFEIKTSRV